MNNTAVIAKLTHMLKQGLDHVYTDFTKCGGMKCGQKNCLSCNSEHVVETALNAAREWSTAVRIVTEL